MPGHQERIKDYLEEKTEDISQKIERTPMEKFFVFFLIIITVSALVLGYLQMKKNIESPMYSSYLREKRGELREKYSIENINVNIQAQDVAKLQNQDSDLDGLSDYAELYLYQTSAYLEDTDSDGISDKQEILEGKDPKCPEGQVCTSDDNNSGFGTQTDQLVNDTLGNFDLNGVDFLTLQEQLLTGEITLQELGIQDPQLEAMLDQVKQIQDQEFSAIEEDDKAAVADNLKEMTPDEIRQELIDRGIDAALLEQIDDKTLKQVFIDTLESF